MSHLAVHSVRFASPENRDAIRLRDPKTDRLICLRPEWIRGERSVPAAFVRGARPTVTVVFARRPGTRAGEGLLRIGARDASGHAVAERTVRLRFDGHGHSQPINFRFARPLPGVIGSRRVTWRWYAAGEAGRPVPIGATRHTLYTTWKAPADPSAWLNLPAPVDPVAWRGRRPWVYLPALQWTSSWAAGKRTDKQICDAIIGRFHESGLKYGIGYHSVRGVLMHGGGYCGGFYLLFQALAGAQGVAVERRSFLVDWRPLPGGRAMWCAIVVESAGTNRKSPAEGASLFHDVDRAPWDDRRVRRVRQRRYRFWGAPGGHHDGHCVNFFRSGGRWYLYDLSFFDRPVALDWRSLPRIDLKHSQAVSRLGNFRSAYLEGAVPFMLGSLPNRGRLYRTALAGVTDEERGRPTDETENGLSPTTRAISTRGRSITFYWGP